MNKRTIRIIGVAVGMVLIALLYGLILRGILHEREQQTLLEEQIGPLEAALADQEEGEQVLPTRQAELATLQAELVAAQFAFPSEVDSTEVLAHVVAAASTHRVNLRQVQARDPLTVTLGTGTYRIFPYDVEVEGGLEAISAFLTALESGPIGTLMLDQVHVQALPTPTALLTPPGSPPIATPTEDALVYRASLLVQVYVRLAGPATTPLPPVGTSVSPEERARQLEALLEQAYQQEDWERVISLLLVLRQIRPTDSTLEPRLVEAYVRDGQRRLAAGQYDLAGADFQAALALQPDNSEALAGLAVLEGLTPTSTPSPTSTPTETPTPTPTITPTITPTPMPYYVLHLTFGPNTRYPDLGCEWFGFVGRVTDASGYPIGGVRVHVWSPGWVGVWTTTLPSGEYEQYLDNHPRQERWLVQLHEGDVPVSAIITVDSRADCNATVIQMDWQRGY